MEEYGDVLAEEGRGYAERITAASQQMSGLIDALLETSRIARATIHLQTLDLSDEVEIRHGVKGLQESIIVQSPLWLANGVPATFSASLLLSRLSQCGQVATLPEHFLHGC